ncbi:dihydrolipoamide acetyltransferase family protein [Pengzhenrongella sp.]|jgi:pyruvate dehydrogenase E2 component (dihydrolipoamide acetyltransferase)|uniref:dihydrolipoamide acetyltransferase family protein n=1 Tax=Pengzhenrongella sp. TaxID=2888820 RepID=UPI002F94AD38
MAIKEITMPDLGEGLTESDLVSWNVAVGDTVELNQVVAEVETAKALVQLPSPYAGVVARLFVEPGATVLVGARIMSITVDEASEGDDGLGDGAGASAGEAATGRTPVLVGYGPPIESSARPARRPRGAAWAAGHRGAQPDEAPIRARGLPERPKSFPPVRKLAHELGVDLALVAGSGPDGVITRDDVLQAAAAAAAATAAAPAAAAARIPTSLPGSREVRTPVTGVRKHTAAAMVASAFTAPHASTVLTVDVTPTMELLASFPKHRVAAGHRLTILTMVAKSMVVALRRHPSLNSRWDEAAGEIVQFGYVNLGIAASTPRGLVVPNVKDAQWLDLVELADALAHLTATARAGTTSPADLAGGTISITNIGVFGVDSGTPILVPGEAAILAIGAVRRRPWEFHDEIALRSVLTLTLSFDHRVVDGAQAAQFLADVGAILADPGVTITF